MRRLAWLVVGLTALVGVLVRPVFAQPDVERVVDLADANAAYGLALGPDGLLYVGDTADRRNGTIFLYSLAGSFEDRISIPAGSTGSVSLRGITFDRFGNLYVADAANGQEGRGRVIKVTPRGRQSVFASGLSAPNGLVFDRSGVLYVTESQAGAIVWIGPDGASAQFVEDERLRPHSGRGPGASGLAFAPGETALYVSNTADDRIIRVAISSDGSAGRVSVMADGPALRGQIRGPGSFDGPEGLAVDSRGNLLVATSRSDAIDQLGPEGRFLSRVPTAGRDGFRSPTALALTGRYAYVVSLGRGEGQSHLARFAVADLDG